MNSHDEETRDLAVRERVFLNLLEAVNRVHDLGVPHLSINPETIWVENNSEVLLFPFRVPYEEETEAYPMWYLAPEYLFNSPEYYFNHEWDMWSLGWIFYDLFTESPPLFASKDPHSKLIKLFEVLGFPDLEHVPYINEDTHMYLYTHTFVKECKQSKMPEIFSLIDHITPPLAAILMNMLHFNPHDRPWVTPDVFLDNWQNINNLWINGSYENYDNDTNERSQSFRDKSPIKVCD